MKEKVYLKVYENKNMVELTNIKNMEELTYKPTTPERERNDIQTFSKHSQRRMKKYLNSLRVDTNTKMITLTQPPLNHTREAYNKTMDVFFKRMVYYYEKSLFVWKFELQKNGSPHIHVLMFNKTNFNNKEWDDLLSKTKKAWFQSLKANINMTYSEEQKFKKAGVRVETARNKDVYNYIVKYISKEECYKALNGINIGRYWGTRNKKVESLYLQDTEQFTIDKNYAVELLSYIDDEKKYYVVNTHGKFTFYNPDNIISEYIDEFRIFL